MNKIVSLTLLLLVVSMAFSGIPISAEAQYDQSILLKIALKAKRHVEHLVSADSSDQVKRLFEEASKEVNLLEKSIENNDPSSTKQHFHSAMILFKRITEMASPEVATTDAATRTDSSLYAMSKLDRLEKYITNLKTIAKKHDARVNFSEIDRLMETAKNNIHNDNLAEAKDNISKIHRLALDIKKTLQNQHEPDRIKNYVQRYIANLDKLIERLNTNDYPQTTIDEFKDAREKLSTASDRHEIIQQIKHINYLKRNLT